MAEQHARVQLQLEERTNELAILRCQMGVVEESNDNLSELLRQANSKVVGLMKELADKNRFIKQYM